MNIDRKTGVVIPVSALYTSDCPAVGDFLALKDFVDFCHKASISIIQLLPVNDTGTQSSPYSGLSAYALHPMYIRISALPEFADAYKRDKAFAAAYRAFKKEFPYKERFDYDNVSSRKIELLHLLYNYIEKRRAGKFKKNDFDDGLTPEQYNFKVEEEFSSFIKNNSWIVYYAVFKDLKDTAMQASWKSWSEDLRSMDRKKIELRWKNKAHRSSHDFFVWCQLRASQQFKDASDYAKSKGIIFKGDLPIMMNEDSADCWAWPEFFNQDLRAGSPPDGENPMGQNWGFPIYNWDNLSNSDFSWWKERVRKASMYYDAFRIDHILGFFRIWCSSSKESTAFLGHTNPYSAFSKKKLEALGFDKDRIKWLSLPHIPTSVVENVTWNHDEATQILQVLCNRVKDEELWTFKEEIKEDSQIYEKRFCDNDDKDKRVKDVLAAKWRDRTLIEITKDSFIPVYSYNSSTSWKSLSKEEQAVLLDLFNDNKEREEKLWEQQALQTLVPICSATEMIPCAEDLGVNLECMPRVLDKIGIMSLKVIRWTREWDKDGQPFYPLTDLPSMAVCTTSVHDSSTLRQWWNDEKSSVKAYLAYVENAGLDLGLHPEIITEDMIFDEGIAEFCLRTGAQTGCNWFINPLQDYLYLCQKYYKENSQEERINVPGSVNSFNWTYRIPVSIQDLQKDKTLLSKITKIAVLHSSTNLQK